MTSGNYNSNNWIFQQGNDNSALSNNQLVPSYPPVEYRDLINAANALRNQLEPLDREALDSSMKVVESGGGQERHTALRAIIGIATTVGQIGAPVVNAVTALLRVIGV